REQRARCLRRHYWQPASLGDRYRHYTDRAGDAVKWLDSLTEGSARSLAKRTSRRGFIGSLGALLVGASTLPLLPVARGASPPEASKTPDEKAKHVNDPTSCDYWRHCAIDGY